MSVEQGPYEAMMAESPTVRRLRAPHAACPMTFQEELEWWSNLDEEEATMDAADLETQIIDLYYEAGRQHPMRGEPLAFVSMEAGHLLRGRVNDENALRDGRFALAWDRVGPVLVVPSPRVARTVVLLVDHGTGEVVHTGEFRRVQR